MGVPTALFPAPSSVTPSSASSAAALPLTSPSSGYVPYLPPSEVLRSVRALQELLFRLFPSEIRPSSPDFDILGFLDNAFELLRSTGYVPTLLWIDVVLSRFSPAFSSVYRHLAKAGFVRFLVCVIDSTKLSMEKIRDRVSRLRKASNESYLNLSARLKQLLRLLRLALIHYPGSLIQEALKDELLHPDLVHQPASVHCPVQALLEGTPLPVEDLQRARVALFYATADDAYHSFFLPRPVGDPTPETELFELMARCELCPIPPPPSEDSTSSMRLVQRHYPSGASVATVWADPDGPSTTPPEPSRPIPRRFPSPAYSPPSRRAPQRPFRSHPGHTVPGGTTGSSAPSHSEPLLHAPERPSQRSGTYKEDKSGTHNNEEKKKMQPNNSSKTKRDSLPTQLLPDLDSPEQLLEYAQAHGWTRKLHYLQRSTQSLRLDGSHPDDSPEKCLALLQREENHHRARRLLQGFIQSMKKAIARAQQREEDSSSSSIHGVRLEDDEKEPSSELIEVAKTIPITGIPSPDDESKADIFRIAHMEVDLTSPVSSSISSVSDSSAFLPLLPLLLSLLLRVLLSSLFQIYLVRHHLLRNLVLHWQNFPLLPLHRTQSLLPSRSSSRPQGACNTSHLSGVAQSFSIQFFF